MTLSIAGGLSHLHMAIMGTQGLHLTSFFGHFLLVVSFVNSACVLSSPVNNDHVICHLYSVLAVGLGDRKASFL